MFILQHLNHYVNNREKLDAHVAQCIKILYNAHESISSNQCSSLNIQLLVNVETCVINNSTFCNFTASPVIFKPMAVKKFSNRLSWVPMENGKIPIDALIGGFENEPIYIARANHNNSISPGKFVPSKGLAYVSWGHREHSKRDFEVCLSKYSLLIIITVVYYLKGQI